jgi:TolB-like protein
LIPGLRVAGSAGGRSEPRDSAARPSTAIRLEATVQRERDRVRVLPRLISVASDSTVWVNTFEGSTNSLFALQDTVARAVVRAVTDRVRR